jgi:hypothetical protein
MGLHRYVRLELHVNCEMILASRTCLDLLNDSIAGLPEEKRRLLDEFLHCPSRSIRFKGSKRKGLWRYRW